VEAEVVLVNDGVAPSSDACEEPFINASDLIGQIALIDRGSCTFADKIRRAQDAGAIAVIIANNEEEDFVFIGGDGSGLIIPAVGVTHDAGQILRALPSGTTLRVELQKGTVHGRPFLNTPPVFQASSSLSHWAESTEPDLLMEPIISSGTIASPDLALTALRELGWQVRNIPFPSLDYALWTEVNELGDLQPSADDDQDGATNLEEYAFGSDPLDPLSRPQIDFRVNSVGENFLTFERSNQAADLTYTVTVSNDLHSWMPLPASEGDTTTSTPGNPENLLIQRELEILLEKRFFQVNADFENP
jgi:hypothetical protein